MRMKMSKLDKGHAKRILAQAKKSKSRGDFCIWIRKRYKTHRTFSGCERETYILSKLPFVVKVSHSTYSSQSKREWAAWRAHWSDKVGHHLAETLCCVPLCSMGGASYFVALQEKVTLDGGPSYTGRSQYKTQDRIQVLLRKADISDTDLFGQWGFAKDKTKRVFDYGF